MKILPYFVLDRKRKMHISPYNYVNAHYTSLSRSFQAIWNLNRLLEGVVLYFLISTWTITLVIEMCPLKDRENLWSDQSGYRFICKLVKSDFVLYQH